MQRTKIIKILQAINLGKTFYRSGIPHTMAIKVLWDELKAEVREGYSIDLPREMDQVSKRA